MPEGYSSHSDYMEWVKGDADSREKEVEVSLRKAFSRFIEKREVEVVLFNSMTAGDLAKAIQAQPIILKALVACCNIAARAIERDLGIKNVDTYSPHITAEEAHTIAGYVKPFLPPFLELPTLSKVDRISYIDKEIRKGKGRWEKIIINALNRYGKKKFKKRLFEVGGDFFELDAATPEEGEIEIGIDVKRIEARRDIHKRCDEIVNKADKLKSVLPGALFGAVIYYPFIDEHVNIQSRLKSSKIDGIVFASESEESVDSAVRMLLSIVKEAK